jgi:hypothetical protein
LKQYAEAACHFVVHGRLVQTQLNIDVFAQEVMPALRDA